MADTLKNRARFSTTISFENKEKLTKLSKETGIPVSTLIDRALEMLFEKYGIDPNEYTEEDESPNRRAG